MQKRILVTHFRASKLQNLKDFRKENSLNHMNQQEDVKILHEFLKQL